MTITPRPACAPRNTPPVPHCSAPQWHFLARSGQPALCDRRLPPVRDLGPDHPPATTGSGASPPARAVLKEECQLHPGADVHLPIDRPEVEVDRVAREKEPARRLLVGEALGHEVGDLELGIRKAGPPLERSGLLSRPGPGGLRPEAIADALCVEARNLLCEAVFVSEDVGDRPALMMAAERAVALLGSFGQDEAAATIGGFFTTPANRMRSILPRRERSERWRTLELLRERLGNARYEELIAKGVAMSDDEAIASVRKALGPQEDVRVPGAPPSESPTSMVTGFGGD